MGLFNFFRKKEKPSSTSNQDSNSAKELLAYSMDLLCQDKSLEEVKESLKAKGLGDEAISQIAEKANFMYEKFFAKPADDKSKTEEENKEESLHEKIKLTSDDQGSHGDNFGGLVGFHYLETKDGESFINMMVAKSSISESISSKAGISIKQADFSERGDSALKIRTINSGEQVISAFPFLQTSYALPYATKEIVEWSHVQNLEAEIKGGGRETFGFGFFATDYGVNKSKYHASNSITVKVSAICLVMDKSDLTEINGQAISENFASYMPSKDIPRPTYYDFIGIAQEVEEIKLPDNGKGFIIKVKLINDESNPDFFAVDMFVNQENMRIDKVEKGMQVTGALWFQGELVA